MRRQWFWGQWFWRQWFWVLAGALLMSAPALASDGPVPETLVERAEGCTLTICVPGRYEFHYIHSSNYAVDSSDHAAGTGHGIVDRGVQRWRLRPRMTFSQNLFIEVEADLLTGQVFGDTTPVGRDFLLEPRDRLDAFGEPRATDLRAFYLSWKSPIGLLRVGQQTSEYGFGILANNGDDEDHAVFDSPRAGDVVERILFATRPFASLGGDFATHFSIAGGFDVVFKDDNADLLAGDLALQGIVSLNYRTDPLHAGVYMAFRNQEDRDGDTLDAQAFEVFVRWRTPIDAIGAKLSLGVDLALINGQTTRVIQAQAPTGIDVLSLGAVFQGTLSWPQLGLETRLELGYASGDHDPNDQTSRAFRFDPGYQVGMILFQEVMDRVSAQSVEHIRDPALSGGAPRGVEMVATDGSVTNALYINPIVRWEATWGLGADLGVLVAWSESPFSDPYEAAKNGGYAANFLGRPLTDDSSRFLGTELDTGLHYTLRVRELVSLRVGVQAGFFVPGGAFDPPPGRAALGTVYKVRTNMEVGF